MNSQPVIYMAYDHTTSTFHSPSTLHCCTAALLRVEVDYDDADIVSDAPAVITRGHTQNPG